MRRSELKHLIKEVIEEIMDEEELDLYSADYDFDEVVDIQTPARDPINNVPVHVYIFDGPPQKIVVLPKNDISYDNKVVFKKGEDISDYIVIQSGDKIRDRVR